MHLPLLIQDLALILGVAGLVTLVFRFIKQPVVLGYIAAGIIVGPHTPSFFSVRDNQGIQIWAELGVIFLMFSLGLEFSFRRLMGVGFSAVFTAVIQILVMLFLGKVVANQLGYTIIDGMFLGCMLAVSSTTIIIKAFEELRLKGRKFAELVYGILIVEDLAAILMLVALNNMVGAGDGGGDLLQATVKLVVVVGAWFLVGMFVIPRLTKLVGKYGNDEMLTVVAFALCLVLVWVAAKFHYSVALGAFMMGSLLAESSEASRIEHLVQPLKDLFGAVFFVSVGMLLDPVAIVENGSSIFWITLVIIVGKIFGVALGAMLSGQTFRNSVHSGFSMGQIGEFSFIIGTLGVTQGVLTSELYPIVVACSLTTTFATPYLMRYAQPFAMAMEKRMPVRIQALSESYMNLLNTSLQTSEEKNILTKTIIKWALNAIVVIVVFSVSADKILPLIKTYFLNDRWARITTWSGALLLCLPSFWAMFTLTGKPISGAKLSRRVVRFENVVVGVGRFLTTLLICGVTFQYFSTRVTLIFSVLICAGLLFLFRSRLDIYYSWLEKQFNRSFQAKQARKVNNHSLMDMKKLAPWDAHLTEIEVPANSDIVRKSLAEIKINETLGITVVVIIRNGFQIVAPKSSELLYPLDRLLCFGADDDMEKFRIMTRGKLDGEDVDQQTTTYSIRRVSVLKNSILRDKTIKSSQIREKFHCIIVGIERDSERIVSPASQTKMVVGDVLWVVGHDRKLIELLASVSSHPGI